MVNITEMGIPMPKFLKFFWMLCWAIVAPAICLVTPSAAKSPPPSPPLASPSPPSSQYAGHLCDWDNQKGAGLQRWLCLSSRATGILIIIILRCKHVIPSIVILAFVENCVDIIIIVSMIIGHHPQHNCQFAKLRLSCDCSRPSVG